MIITRHLDQQQVELAGRGWLIGQLLMAGLEVARPERDRGVDLIIYWDRQDDKEQKFVALPVQMKAAMREVFSLDPKYAEIPGLIMVYVWNLRYSTKTMCFGVTYSQAYNIAEAMGYTKTTSWKTGASSGKRGYSTTSPSKRLKLLLEPYLMEPMKWIDFVENAT